MGSSYLITGGARSGKSRYALKLAETAKHPYYIATGWAGDEEMSSRIARHKKERGPHWSTIETRTGLAEAIRRAESEGADMIIADCLTLWVSNLLCEERTEKDFEEALSDLERLIPTLSATIVFVSNEVGCGIVPGDPMSRRFRDWAGFTNQRIAAAASNVIMAVSGLPLALKSASQTAL
ncbi:MAG: bifunctional adenosylcobinamide kinase/adenosylcobinamide-phosphate guanylyltransferase [Lentisphaerae bacterium GWF2_52_8]|nr:MAG: bifunctional adenosylcobinamide kinase/adenosylcobinamide-phosphate guanylyltransferase [Lentisphaerae bacterium GWF2_52_8]